MLLASQVVEEVKRMALAALGPRPREATLNSSLVEEFAHQAVCSKAAGAQMTSLPRYVGGTATWLSVLHRFEHLLVFMYCSVAALNIEKQTNPEFMARQKTLNIETQTNPEFMAR